MTELVQANDEHLIAQGPPALIEIDGLAWNDKRAKGALTGVTLKVDAGSVYCVLGAPGSGKTMLVRLLVNAIRPVRGSAKVDGINVTDRPIDARRRTLFVTSDCQWYGSLSCRDNVATFTRIAGQNTSYDLVDNALRRCGVPDRLLTTRTADVDHDIRLLMWLATAFTRNVRVVILDDPVIRISHPSLREVEEAVDELRSADVAIMMTTADVTWAARMATTIGVLEDGKIISEHTPLEWQDERLSDFCAHLFTRIRGLPMPAVSAESPGTTA